jgi:hypothetical protein
VTFKDIYHDYRNFRSAYYFYQLPSPKEIYEKNEVQIDTKNFKIPNALYDLIKNHKKHVPLSPQYMFNNIMGLIITFYVWRLVRKPFEWYYHWDDPIKADDKAAALNLKEEDIRERLRYKRKVKDWQLQQEANGEGSKSNS